MTETFGGVVEIKAVELENILKKYKGRKEFLICILQDIQEKYGYIPEEAIVYTSEKLDIPLIQIYSVATFFKAFRLQPRGEHLVQVCLGTACHVRGGERILDKVQRTLGIGPGESITTDKKSFSLETVNCLGACALGPVMVVDGKYYRNMTTNKVDPILKKYYLTSGSRGN
jgi:NADH-quinone oxidoreductase subunit E